MTLSPAEIFENGSRTDEFARTQAYTQALEQSQTLQVKTVDWWHTPASPAELLFTSVVILFVGVLSVALLSHYPYYPCCFGQLSDAIRHWDFKNLPPTQPKEFWGYSYIAALVATVTRVPDNVAIVIVSASMFILANYLCYRLWGRTVAAWFMVVNWFWIDTAVEGMTEPLFMALLLGSFIAIRRERWTVAALLASGATVVRPVGIFALFALAIVLFSRREFRQLIIASAIGLTTGVLYVIPMIAIFGDPLANFRGYHSNDWSSAFPISLPLLPLIHGAFLVKSTQWKLQILNAAWVGLAVIGVTRMAVDKRFWRYAKAYPAEAIFVATVALFQFSYNAPEWCWYYFPRFVIPMVPFIILVFLDRLPRDKRIIWAVGLFNIVLTVWPKIGTSV